MRISFPAILLTVGLLFCEVAARAEQTFAPIPAAEGERAVAEEVNFFTDIIWVGMDVRWHAGEWDECVRLTREIVLLDPHHVEAWTSGAWVLWNMDRDEEAVAMYKQGLAANPGDPDLYFDFGFYYRYRKQYDKAIEMFRQVAKHGGEQDASAHAA